MKKARGSSKKAASEKGGTTTRNPLELYADDDIVVCLSHPYHQKPIKIKDENQFTDSNRVELEPVKKSAKKTLKEREGGRSELSFVTF